MEFLSKPFGVLMEFIYKTLAFENYGLAILIFTIIIKILLMPLQIKQQRSMIKTQEIQPELKELQKTYANDRNKLAEEQQKLYAKHNISMTAGCFPMLIQFPLIMALYEIIRYPLTYISGVSGDVLEKATKILELPLIGGRVNEISLIDKLASAENFEKVNGLISKSDIINMDFLGIFDLGKAPSWNPSKIMEEPGLYLPLLLIPILSFLSAILLQKMSVARTKRNKQEDKKKEGMGMAGGMMKIMPILSLIIAFTVPAGLGLYWTISNVLSIAQMALINKILAKQKEGRL